MSTAAYRDLENLPERAIDKLFDGQFHAQSRSATPYVHAQSFWAAIYSTNLIMGSEVLGGNSRMQAQRKTSKSSHTRYRKITASRDPYTLRHPCLRARPCA